MKTSLSIGAVPAHGLPLVWSKVEPMLAAAVETSGGIYHIADVYDQLAAGELLLWVVADDLEPVAAFTTRISQLPGAKCLAVDWTGGSRMREWMPIAQELLMRYAKDNKCTQIEGYGRVAWGRWLRRYGWKPAYTAYKLEINDG